MSVSHGVRVLDSRGLSPLGLLMAQQNENSWLQTQRKHWYGLMKQALSRAHKLIRVEIKDRMGDKRLRKTGGANQNAVLLLQ